MFCEPCSQKIRAQVADHYQEFVFLDGQRKTKAKKQGNSKCEILSEKVIARDFAGKRRSAGIYDVGKSTRIFFRSLPHYLLLEE